MLKDRFRDTGVYDQLREMKYRSNLYYAVRRRKLDRAYQAWLAKPTLPSPMIRKVQIIDSYRQRYGTRVLVETGTYLGDTLDALADRFSKIYSIEMSPMLHRWAKARLRKHPHITLYCGDSAVLLPSVISQVNEPALFWLDAHYSGGQTARGDSDTPILAELRSVFEAENSGKRHVILIDDARDFVGGNGYPTLAAVEELVANKGPDLIMQIEEDIIRITPA